VLTICSYHIAHFVWDIISISKLSIHDLVSLVLIKIDSNIRVQFVGTKSIISKHVSLPIVLSLLASRMRWENSSLYLGRLWVAWKSQCSSSWQSFHRGLSLVVQLHDLLLWDWRQMIWDYFILPIVYHTISLFLLSLCLVSCVFDIQPGVVAVLTDCKLWILLSKGLRAVLTIMAITLVKEWVF
jgi:hypothetical protein